jgi:hypothetical protein
MRILPCAADFDFYLGGKLAPWNNAASIAFRWQAANLARTGKSLDDAAKDITQIIRQEMGNDSVTIMVRKQEP